MSFQPYTYSHSNVHMHRHTHIETIYIYIYVYVCMYVYVYVYVCMNVYNPILSVSVLTNTSFFKNRTASRGGVCPIAFFYAQGPAGAFFYRKKSVKITRNFLSL